MLVDTLPALRKRLLPRLQYKAAVGASEMKATPHLNRLPGRLQTVTFGAFGSCELLAHAQIAATCDTSVPFKKRQPSFKQVLCVIEYELDSCQGSLQRRNKGTISSRMVNPGSTFDRVDRTACAEFRALAAMEKLLKGQPNHNGKMAVAVTEPPCVSCLAAMVHFSQQYPDIKIEVSIDGALLRFGTEVGRFRPFSECRDGEATKVE